MLVVIFPVSRVISKRLCRVKEDSDFWQITERRKGEARDLTILQSSGWGVGGRAVTN